jgi:hypothetical protein
MKKVGMYIGRRVYFKEKVNYLFPEGLTFTGIVKDVVTSANGVKWVVITNIESMDRTYCPSKTEKKKRFDLVFYHARIDLC